MPVAATRLLQGHLRLHRLADPPVHSPPRQAQQGTVIRPRPFSARVGDEPEPCARPSDRSPRHAGSRSRHGDGEGGECVEISTRPHTIHIRNSKNPTDPQLTLSTDAWDRFLGLTGR
ncbi:DUF397 domain-containing protein [Streptomyces sp. NPDC093252]|uniref:DUF397 domain-containing protein n=1 Tax=Streptomyces sp. NPDC093252 TaxID=3154980 RepID=UPI00343FFF0D